MNQRLMVRRSAQFVLRKHSLKRRAYGQSSLLHSFGRANLHYASSYASLSTPFSVRSENTHSYAASDTRAESSRLLPSWNPLPHRSSGRWLSTTAATDENEEIDSEEKNPLDPHDKEERRRNEKKSECHGTSGKGRRKDRRHVCRLIPGWLQDEPSFFDATVKALNLNTSTASRLRKRDSNIVMSNRELFDDSIPSFWKWLQNLDKLPADVEGALDQLADAGFANKVFSKNFQSMYDDQIARDRMTESLQESIKAYKKRQSVIEDILSVVADLELERGEMERKAAEYEKMMAPKLEDKNTDSVANAVISLFTGGLQKATKQDAVVEETEEKMQGAKLAYKVTKQKLRHLQRKIDGRKSHIEVHELGSLKMLSTIEGIKRQLEELQSPMTDQEYERTVGIVKGVLPVICGALADHIQNRHSKLISQYQDLDSKTDLTKPHEWYPFARLDKRKIIYHGGPTNSGKTYSALQRLKTAKRGLYVGPLRLLAAEVYETLNAQGVYTSLMTGQERRDFPFATHIAATVEMAANLLVEEFEVVVIDEIQMIADRERGYAWTRALIGLRCKEIHVCGGLEAKGLIKRIVDACGDDFEINTYERFGGELKVASKSLAARPNELNSYERVRAGDCIVAFSRNDIFSIKREIERYGRFKCCVIYGTLPPGTRTTQAKLFNDPDSGYDILIASDAIGMGLNLNIRRIVFNSIFKNDGNSIIRLDHSAVKQIAGRAGRRNSPYPEGEVTTRDPRDLSYIKNCLATEIQPVERAGLIFTASMVGMFEEAMKNYYHGDDQKSLGNEEKPLHLHWLLQEFSKMAVVRGNYFLCKQEDMIVIAQWLKNVSLETGDKYMYCMAPISTQNPKARDVLVKYGQKMALGEVPGLTRSTPMKRPKTFHDLALLCSIYSEVELFIWLQNKFPPLNLMEQQAAMAKRDMASAFISQGLDNAERLRLDHCHIDRDKKLRTTWTREQEKNDEEDDPAEEEEDIYTSEDSEGPATRARRYI